eukprot:g28617.t1
MNPILWHVFCQEAEQRFREVAEAYEVLSNADRRRQYDAGQMDGGQGGFGGFDFPDFGNFGFDFTDPKDLFKEMFGSEDPFADFHKFFDDVQFEENVSWRKHIHTGQGWLPLKSRAP